MDTPATLRGKVKVLATFLKRAKACCVYTGAGISTSTGIGDYASKATKSRAPHRTDPGAGAGNRLAAAPAYAHHLLAALGAKGRLAHWLQQNHDRPGTRRPD